MTFARRIDRASPVVARALALLARPSVTAARALLFPVAALAGCGGANPPEFWIAPHGSETNLYLADVEPHPF